MQSPATPTRSRTRWLLLGGTIFALALTFAFGWTTWQAHAAFRSYREATLNNPGVPPLWQQRALTPEECVDQAMAWVEACPGIPSWCEAAMADPMKMCLTSQDRTAYCAQQGDEVLSTRFGFATCKKRYDAIADTYARRAAKKSCAAAQRVIARFCRPDQPLVEALEEDEGR